MLSVRIIKKAIFLLKNKAWRKGLYYGVGAGIEHLPFLKSLNLDCLVDVGANKGQFALVVRGLFSNVKIHSFEPLKEPAKTFNQLFLNDPLCELYNNAIGENEGEVKIHVSKKDDSSSLLPITDCQSDLFPGTEEDYEDSVVVMPLNTALSSDDVFGSALLKIDVQGFELSVLKGCNEYLNKFQHIYVECSFVELYKGQALAYQVIEYLSEKGFDLSGIYNISNDKQGIPIQADFYFKKS